MANEKRLLEFLAYSHIFAGVALFTVFFMPFLHADFIGLIYIGQPLDPAVINNAQVPFWVCVFGPTLASWGILLLALLQRYFENPDKSQWWYLVAALCIWAPLDTLLCFVNDLYIGAALNALVFATFLILWVRVRALAWNPQ